MSNNRSAHVALIQYVDGILSYIIAPVTLRPGDTVIASEKAAIAPGNCLPLKNIPVGTIIHNLEIRPGIGGGLQRAAGTFAVIKSKTDTTATVKLNSTEIRAFDLRCWAVIGQVGNLDHRVLPRGKAGGSRWLGITPKVRGIAMNPNQHPHGGGNGAKHLCQPTKSLWGVRTFQRKTRSKIPLGMIYKRKLNGRQNKKYGIARG